MVGRISDSIMHYFQWLLIYAEI